MPRSRPLAERFWEKVQKSDGCWEWTASRARAGYGRIGRTGRDIAPAHRVAWELTNGPIPPGLFVCHKCDNPPCVRPDHLFLGTNKDNMVDMAEKGRASLWRLNLTHCIHGHEFTPENTAWAPRISKRGLPTVRRRCRECLRQWARAATRRRNAA